MIESEWDRLERIDREAEEAALLADIDARPFAPLEAYGDNVVGISGDIEIKPPEDEPLPLPGRANLLDWKDKRPPDRRFIIPGWIVRGSAGLLSGMEGVGKSLVAQQMATCAAVGKPFLGLEIEHVNAVYISCEDEMDELWRRQESINLMLGITMDDVAGHLELISLKGEIGNELATFESNGRLVIQERYRQIAAMCLETNPGLVFLDNAAHFFTGNENARHDVAAFLGLIEQLSILIDGAVVLLAHPNKQFAQGNMQGNEYSGSTGWSAHVRNRLFLDYARESEDGLPIDDDDRILRKSKANYGKKGEEIAFRWLDWAFTTMADLPPNLAKELEATTRATGENARYLECLDKSVEQRRPTSLSRAASNFAPRVFAKMTEAKGMKAEAFETAQERLLSLGQIVGDMPIYRRDNRTWATGVGRAEECTNPRTNPAKSGAQSVHKPATNHSTNPHCTAPTSTTYLGEPLEGSPNQYDGAGDWQDNPILNGKK